MIFAVVVLLLVVSPVSSGNLGLLIFFGGELAEDLWETNLVSKQLDLMQELTGWERSLEDSSHISPDVTMLDLFGKEPLHFDPIPCLLQKIGLWD